MCIAHTASVMFSVSVLPSVHRRGGGGSGQMHYLANVPGIEHFLAKKCSYPEGGVQGKYTIWLMSQGLSSFLAKNIPECHAGCLYSCISIMHCSLPVISLVTCCQKEVLKACTCLYSQATRHSGILLVLYSYC